MEIAYYVISFLHRPRLGSDQARHPPVPHRPKDLQMTDIDKLVLKRIGQLFLLKAAIYTAIHCASKAWIKQMERF